MSLPKPTITLTNQTRIPLGLPRLKRLLVQVFDIQKITRGCWSITFVNDQTMAQLHQRTMNLPTTTDVLTFDLRDSSPSLETGNRKLETQLDLDTVICVPEAKRQARLRRHSLADELLLYAIHSLLHVRGYDDQTPAQARRMHRREDLILVRLGIGPIYARAEKNPAQQRGAST